MVKQSESLRVVVLKDLVDFQVSVRAAGVEELIAAPGTSCRHQILDGTGRKVLHPGEVLWGALE